jgi:hypothetical protein
MSTPDAEMMAVVERLAQCMAAGVKDSPKGIFADAGATIVENFPPYIFAGPDAVARWTTEMRAHLDGITDLHHRFDEVHDFSRTGEEAYFALRTRWIGVNRGKPFEETGGWAFVLTRRSGEWRVFSYGWAVIATAQTKAD